MNAPKVSETDYIQFLIAAQRVYSCVEAGKVSPEVAAHDAYTRLLSRLPPDTEALWAEAKALLEPTQGVLILDDSTLDKPYARQIELVTRHWSGKHHAVVQGINLESLVWSDGESIVPVDCRLYAKAEDQYTKNDHARAMFTTAKERGFEPKLVMFDSWYASLANLKHLRAQNWSWLCRLKSNRQVDPDDTGNRAIAELDIPEAGLQVHLKGYGFIKVFRTVSPHGDAQHWATSDLDMSLEQFNIYAKQAWAIETYHRAIKQTVGIEKAQVRSSLKQRNHILLALRAYLRLEAHRLQTGISWYQAKFDIVRGAIQDYLAHPAILLPTA
jgi:putative transposase